MLAADLPYFTLEDPDIRSYATDDPRSFLGQAKDGAVLPWTDLAPLLGSLR